MSSHNGDTKRPFAAVAFVISLLVPVLFLSGCLGITGLGTVTVTYHPNGADGGTVPDPVVVSRGKTVTIADGGDLWREGYEFDQWNAESDASGSNWYPGEEMEFWRNIDLHAEWVPAGSDPTDPTDPTNLRLIYDPGLATSGQPPVDDQLYQAGEHAEVLGNTRGLALDDEKFFGWYTGQFGSGEGYAPGDFLTFDDHDVVLYADWGEGHCVNYHRNGATVGNVPIDNSYYATGEIATLLPNLEGLALPGHVMVGWNTQPDGTGVRCYAWSGFQIGLHDVDFHAEWEPGFRVIYHGNLATAGTPPVDDTLYLENWTPRIKDNTGNLSRDGYYFAGWNTEPGGGGEDLLIGEYTRMPAGDLDVYAQWLPNYAVTYDGNGQDSGDPPIDPLAYQPDDEAIVLGNPNGLTLAGYGLAAWNTTPEGDGTDYQPGDLVIVPVGGITLFARWEPAYAITYDGNGYSDGDPPVDDTVYPAGDEVVVAATGTMTRTGHDFTGWNTNPGGTGSRYDPGATITMIVDGITLYAEWVLRVYDIQILDTDVQGAFSIAVGDVHVNGYDDLVVAAKSMDSIFMYQNDGAGGFSKNTVSSNETGVRSVAVAELNGDALPDILSVSHTGNYVRWHENLGGGSFAAHTIDGTSPGATSVAPTDADGDGAMDLVVTDEELNAVTLYRSNGDGTFSSLTIDASGQMPWHAVCLDLDQDGDDDILVAHLLGLITWYENDGSASYTRHEVVSASTPVAVAADDMDGDGDVDIVAALFGSSQIVWLENNGNEAFTSHLVCDGKPELYAVTTADADMDGDPDVLLASRDHAWWIENRNLAFVERLIHEEAGSGYAAVASLDMDEDGDLDAAICSMSRGRVDLLENAVIP